MAAERKEPKAISPQLLIVVVVTILILFIVVLATLIDDPSSTDPVALSAASYASRLDAIMPAADADIGAGLINEHDCFACHVLGDGSISPLFDGIGGFAEDRRPPLTAAAYLYESIVNPGLFLVEGYSDSMPNTYNESLTQEEIGHIIAYLLTLTE